MIVTCPRCARKYNLDPARLGGKSTATLRCSACQATIEVKMAAPEGDRTMRLPADASLLPSPERIEAGPPSLPAGTRVSLAVLQGPDAGKMIRIDKASVVIGRHDADVVLDDPEVSRRHAQLDLHGGKAVVRDLGSTNGTFVEDRKVAEAEIVNHGEFRVGATRLMLILTDSGEGEP